MLKPPGADDRPLGVAITHLLGTKGSFQPQAVVPEDRALIIAIRLVFEQPGRRGTQLPMP